MKTPVVDYTTLQSRMAARRMYNKDLANLIGYSGAIVGRWFRHGTPMPGDAIIKVTEIFNLTPDEVYSELLGLEPCERRLTDSDVVNYLARRRVV